jgi:hypothetical protein
MPTYLVEVYMPRSHAQKAGAAGARARAAAAGLSREGVAVRYVRTMFLPDDETCFHLFEARSAGSVEEVCRQAGLGRVRIVPAIEATTGTNGDQSQA